MRLRPPGGWPGLLLLVVVTYVMLTYILSGVAA